MGKVIETQIIETDENGRRVIPAELLGKIRQHEKYTIERSETDIVLHLLGTDDPSAEMVTEKLTFDEWQQQWKELQTRMSQVWKTDKSAAVIIAEMRR